jgi:hypothetical protein
MTWFTMANPPGSDRPAWMRSAALADDGTVFAPAAIAGNELRSFLVAAWDGDVPTVTDHGHYYLPTSWLAREYPDVADIGTLIEKRVAEFTARETTP